MASFFARNAFIIAALTWPVLGLGIGGAGLYQLHQFEQTHHQIVQQY